MKKKGVMLRSSSAALLISLALSLFSYAGTADEKGYDGLVTGDQAIRIAAGELNVTGGKVHGNSVSDDEDIMDGGNG